MKEISLFEYSTNNTLIHRVNPVLKLILLLVYCLLAAVADSYLFVVPAVLIIILFVIAGKSLLKQIPAYWKIYIFFLASGTVKYITSGSLYEGTAFSLRMLLMMWAGIIFYSTTRLTQLRRMFFSLSPGFSALQRISDLIVMTLAFFPTVFKALDEQNEARYARCFRNTGHPIRTIRLSAVPLMIELFLKAEEMADAWYSRG